MEGFGSFVLDFLSEFAGGRGDPSDDLPRFGLSAIFWLIIWGFVLSSYRRYSHSRERWLLVGCSIALAQAVFMVAVKALKLYGVVPGETVELFFPPIDHTLTFVMRSVIAAAFIHYLLQSRKYAVTYLRLSLAVSALFYVGVAPWWWWTVSEASSGIKFSNVWADWLAHSIGMVLTIAAMAIFFRTRGWVFVTITIVFSMFLLDDVLMLVNLATNEVYKPVFAPIRNNLQLWAIPLFGYIYWREQADIHERLIKKQQQSDRLEEIGRLASGIAHDFNNHLQAILGFSELGAYESDSKKQVETFNHIATSTDRAAALVNQLLSFSRQQEDSTFENVYLKHVIPDLVPMLRRIIGSQITVHTEENYATKAVWIEQSMLEQIIINLAVNARDAMPHGGHIHLRTQDVSRADSIDRNDPPAGNWIRLEVSDSGEGMDSEMLEHIFEPFFTTKEVGKGTGLGLATVQNIVQKVGGSITVSSDVGSGTTMVVHLPVSTVVDLGTTVTSGSSSLPTGMETILVAEDDQVIRELTAGMLESAGYRVLTASDGQQAINVVKESEVPIDLLLFDVAMPRLNGYLSYEAIKEETGPVPVIFFTANTERVSKFRPEYYHLSKPVGRIELLTQVRAKLDMTESAIA